MNRHRHEHEEDYPPPLSYTTSSHMDVPKRTNTEVRNAEQDIHAFADAHAWDPNYEPQKLKALDQVLEGGDGEKEIQLDHELQEVSPYPEVEASVKNTDDHTLPANTVRAWFLGIIFATLASGINMFLSLRQPSITLYPLVILLVVYPVGCFMAKVLPTHQFNTFGLKWTLNPGPFNVKEHTLITIMANVCYGAAYSTDTLLAQLKWYNVDFGFKFAILFTLASQMIGLGIAGVFKPILVTPAAMIYPSNLPITAMFNTLHNTNSTPEPGTANGWRIGRYRFFLYIMIGSFIYYWIPGFLFQAVSMIAWLTWIKPDNVQVNRLFGGNSGLNIAGTIFSLDWTTITAQLGSPLMYPVHALVNTTIGLVIFIWIFCGIIGSNGTWFSDYVPMSANKPYDNTGHIYKIAKVLTPDNKLDEEAYKNYSPLYLPTTLAVSYGLSFASISGVVMHCILYHGKDIVARFRKSNSEPLDIHAKLYARYRDVPAWWFYAMLLFSLTLGILSVVATQLKEQLPIWAFFLAIGISLFFMLPIGIVYAMTNIQIGLNVFVPMLFGYILPGNPMGTMAFKTYGYITMTQGQTYASDQKLAMYMKVPPRTIFWGQLVATVWGALVQLGVMFWSLGNIRDICDQDNVQKFTCPSGQGFFTSSLVWGVFGPKRMFLGESPYVPLQWFWLIGAALPVVLWLLTKKFPNSFVRYLNAPVIFGGIGYLPINSITAANYWCWFVVGMVFNGWIRRRFRGWWLNYNYILSAALDSGLAFATVLIFVAIQMPNINPPDWWGNAVPDTTLDNYKSGLNATRIRLPKGETFGPSTWD